MAKKIKSNVGHNHNRGWVDASEEVKLEIISRLRRFANCEVEMTPGKHQQIEHLKESCAEIVHFHVLFVWLNLLRALDESLGQVMLPKVSFLPVRQSRIDQNTTLQDKGILYNTNIITNIYYI